MGGIMTDKTESDRDILDRKVTSPLRRQVRNAERTGVTNEVEIRIETKPDSLDQVERHVKAAGAEIVSSYHREVIARVNLGMVPTLADSHAIRLIALHEGPEDASGGVATTQADLLHQIGLTGEGVTIAVIDSEFNLDNEVYADQVVHTIGDDSFYEEDDEDFEEGLHGTNSAEVVAHMAPDADLVLASTRDRTLTHIIHRITDENTSWGPVDVATQSQTYRGRRLDGLDNVSILIQDNFLDGDRLYTSAAGNNATTYHWDGPFIDANDNDLLEYDDQGTERFEITKHPGFGEDFEDVTGDIDVYWDLDWDASGGEFEVRLFDAETGGNLIDSSSTDETPYERVSVTGDPSPSAYLEIERLDDTVEPHFDFIMSHQGQLQFSNGTAERSMLPPATSQADNHIAVAAVDVDFDNLAGYSSRGPTVDGRRGIDLAAPTHVTLSEGSYGGTSAATPHVGGALALLSDPEIGATPEEIRDALFNAARDIADSSVDPGGATNTEIGFGYLNVRVARDILEEIPVQLTEDWTFDTGSPMQYARPLVANGTVIASGLAETVYGLDRNDGSEQWAAKRAGALSDSTPCRWNDTLFVGSGGGVLYAIDIATQDVNQLYSTDSAITSSPVVADRLVPVLGTDRVIFGTNDGRVIAVDASDGELEWEIDLGDPLYTELVTDDVRVYLITNAGRVVALSVKDGEQVWDYQTERHSTRLPSSPSLHDGTLYVSAERVYAFNASDGDVVWDQGHPGSSGSKPTIDETTGRVYIGVPNGNVYGFEADGTPVFNESFGVQTSVIAPGVGPERLIVSTFDGEVHLVDTRLNPGEIIASTDEPLMTRGEPVIDGASIYVGSEDGHLHAYRGKPEELDIDDIMGVL